MPQQTTCLFPLPLKPTKFRPCTHAPCLLTFCIFPCTHAPMTLPTDPIYAQRPETCRPRWCCWCCRQIMVHTHVIPGRISHSKLPIR